MIKILRIRGWAPLRGHEIPLAAGRRGPGEADWLVPDAGLTVDALQVDVCQPALVVRRGVVGAVVGAAALLAGEGGAGRHLGDLEQVLEIERLGPGQVDAAEGGDR